MSDDEVYEEAEAQAEGEAVADEPVVLPPDVCPDCGRPWPMATPGHGNVW